MGVFLRVACAPAALAALIALALAGCGGSSQSASTAAADANGAPAQAASTATAGTTVSNTTTTAGSRTAGSSSTAGSTTAGNTASTASAVNKGVPFEVNTISMEPTYKAETTVYVDPTRTHPRIGDVILFYLPAGAETGSCREVPVGGAPCREPVPGLLKKTSIKRVVGLPGDTIAVRKGHVIRNGKPEPEAHTLPCGPDEQTACEYPKAITVPAGHYYVMSDNRAASKEDSRVFGAVPQGALLGTVEGS